MIPLYKEDCKWYDFWQDMGARIPFCKAGKNMDKSGFFLETCDGCKDYSNKNVITNADRFRAKSDEELADFMCDIGECNRRCPAKVGDCIISDSACKSAWLNWLQMEE